MEKNNLQEKYKIIEGLPVTKKVQKFIGEKAIGKNGKIVFKNINALREFAHKLNKSEIISFYPDSIAQAGEMNGILLMNEIAQKILLRYSKCVKNDVYTQALEYLKQYFSEAELEKLFQNFKKKYNIKLNTEFENEKLFTELINLWLLNNNPVTGKYRDLFDDSELYFETKYLKVIEKTLKFFDNQPFWGKENVNLIKLLRLPAEKFPESIQKQLEYIRQNWSEILGDDFFKLLIGIDILKEEQKFGFPGAGPTNEYDFGFMEDEPEMFSRDLNWMPKVVMIAKSSYVWLDQLSKKYSRSIKYLSDIPDEELLLLSARGFTALWLIGLWERSQASKKIKHISGNTDSIASAYSLAEYRIADDLGGEIAFENLKKRCQRFGIRLASDMVPNHTGIDSKWILEHPDRFLQLDHSPYPNYSFNGINLSPYSDIEIYIEDHYYDKTDAAVVFKYYNKYNGQTRFIYHGNDGTSFPWNDTAQLNYMLSEVREAVINQIIEVARKTPIIRFDAAMTLAKRHFQRLWFPEPGSGGDIPTRAEFALSKIEFNKLMPVEFWREVVDRIAVEAPHTLLLAEAFWMMEGYFVRSLGMHRVYNSAFMNMLKNEENSKYRNSIFKVIEFNPEILKRFVNFMSNPDEETAIAQFGSSDKYFGICVLMCTMPGLPMFAHGQIEGFTERYGMEYSRAKWDETENLELVSRHEREIFPILKKREIFAEVDNFLLYDFITENGELNENVFAYSSCKNNSYSLVIYHNKFETVSGWIKCANIIEKDENNTTLWKIKTLVEAFELHPDGEHYLVFKDQISGKYFVRNSLEIHEKGIFEHLEAFKYKVYLDFYEVADTNDKAYEKLAKYLQGGGTKDINSALKKTYLLPVIKAFNQLYNKYNLKKLIDLGYIGTKEYELFLSDYLYIDLENFYENTRNHLQQDNYSVDLIKKIIVNIAYWLENAKKYSLVHKITPIQNFFILNWLLLKDIGTIISAENIPLESCNMLHDLMLSDEITLMISNNFPEFSFDDFLDWLYVAIKYADLWKNEKLNKVILENIFTDNNVKTVLQINEFEEIFWYNKEKMQEFCSFLKIINSIDNDFNLPKNSKKIKKFLSFVISIEKADKNSEYQVKKLLANMKNN